MSDGSFKIGCFYKVPTVRGKIYHVDRDWPVLGPKHEDAKYISFPYQHFHVDWRFVPERDLKQITSGHLSPLLGLPLVEGVGLLNALLPPPVIRRRQCHRGFPIFPRAIWDGNLQAAFAEHKLKDMICPHRGLPLNGCPMDGDIVTCPGHGLKWNVRTGELVC